MHVQLLLQLSVTGTRFGGRRVRYRRCGDSNHYRQHLTVCDESLHHSLLVVTETPEQYVSDRTPGHLTRR